MAGSARDAPSAVENAAFGASFALQPRSRSSQGEIRMAGLEEIVSEVLIESHEGLEQLHQDLLTLEREPGDQTALGSAFRVIHTIKGTCGFLGFSKLESVTHVGEGLLHRLRDGEMTFSPAVGDLLIEMVDALKEMLASIESGAKEGGGDYLDLIRRLTEAQEGSVRT